MIGPQAPPTHDNPTEAGEEGVTAVVPGIDNFNKQVSGMNVYVQQSLQDSEGGRRTTLSRPRGLSS